MKGEFQRILQEIMKKNILGTSDTWSIVVCPIKPTTQRIILKIVQFIDLMLGLIMLRTLACLYWSGAYTALCTLGFTNSKYLTQ